MWFASHAFGVAAVMRETVVVVIVELSYAIAQGVIVLHARPSTRGN